MGRSLWEACPADTELAGLPRCADEFGCAAAVAASGKAAGLAGDFAAAVTAGRATEAATGTVAVAACCGLASTCGLPDACALPDACGIAGAGFRSALITT